MTMSREELSVLVADVVAEHFERLRADLLEKMLELRTPAFSLTPKGELYIGGAMVGDVRPVFQAAVDQALKSASGDGA